MCCRLPDLFCVTESTIDCIIKIHRSHLWLLTSALFVVEFRSPEGPKDKRDQISLHIWMCRMNNWTDAFRKSISVLVLVHKQNEIIQFSVWWKLDFWPSCYIPTYNKKGTTIMAAGLVGWLRATLNKNKRIHFHKLLIPLTGLLISTRKDTKLWSMMQVWRCPWQSFLGLKSEYN